jgi:RNA polymerase primary sigma factor
VVSNYFAGHPIYEYEFSRAVEEQVISSYDLLMIRVPLSDAELQGYRIAYQEMISYKEKLLLQPGPREGSLSFDRLLRFFKSTQQHSDLIARYEKAFEDSDRFLRDTDSKAKSIRSVASIIKSRGYALVFCDLNTTCENVGIILTNRGVKSQILNQSVPQQDREKYFSQFESGSIQALIAPKVLDEGIDIRLASIGIFAGTSRKKLQTIQRLGRVLRKHPDKHKPLIILPVGIGTEEDPKVQGNEDLAESNYVDVY